MASQEDCAKELIKLDFPEKTYFKSAKMQYITLYTQ